MFPWRTFVLLVALASGLLGRDAQGAKYLDVITPEESETLGALHQGRIVHAEPFGQNGNAGSLWKVRIEHRGHTRTALFKPRVFGDRDGWARTPMEVAVHKLDRILGMNLVPPAAYRRNVDVAGQRFAEGALIAWVDGAHGMDGVSEHELHPSREAFSSDLRILQAISRDADNQNKHNIVRGRHWSDGQWRLMKVDNEATMRSGAYVKLEHRTPTWGEVKRFRQQTYQRLKALDFAELKADVGEFLSDAEIRDWLRTRDGIVAHIDSEAQSRNVFLTDTEIAWDARVGHGPRASLEFRSKFIARLSAKGVRVGVLPDGHPRLAGAQGRTLLTSAGLLVLVSDRSTRAVLVEELVHVRQLQAMAREAGGLARLHASMVANPGRAHRTIARMEVDAKRRTATVQRGTTRQALLREAREYRRQLGEARRPGGRALPRAAATTRTSPDRSTDRGARARQ